MAAEADDWGPFRRAVAECRLHRRPIEDIPAAAVEALERGLDSPTLPVLAAMEGASWSEIAPVLDRVAAETGAPADELEARVLFADSWLDRVADGAVEPEYDYSVAEDLLSGLGGDYEWFRLAIYDLDVLEAMEDEQGLAHAVRAIRERAVEVLSRSPAERLAAPTPTLDDRPFVEPSPPARRRPRFLWRRR